MKGLSPEMFNVVEATYFMCMEGSTATSVKARMEPLYRV